MLVKKTWLVSLFQKSLQSLKILKLVKAPTTLPQGHFILKGNLKI